MNELTTRIWTIGHSTRSLDELVAVLKAHRIERLADVRSFPASTRHPQFHRESLERELSRNGIPYHWLGKELGGYRKRNRPDSPHIALRSPGFRNYADHMETVEFRGGIETLISLARHARLAYMCAERLWWRCHRSLISDYLAALCGVEVLHILDEKNTEAHRLHRTARIRQGHLIYDRGETGALLETVKTE